MAVYYNEIDPYAAQWLRNLIEAGHIAPGEVDTRSIVDVRPDDLRGFTQCHFFAGLGGWSHAARLAGWPDDQPIWTGSCPCQPFSAAGQRKGVGDDRHLWPVFFGLIAAVRPRVVMGEQVASKDGLAWLDTVYADLEGAGYAVRAADLCAAGVGAPHIRQRLWFMADAMHAGRAKGRAVAGHGSAAGDGSAGALAHHHHHGREGEPGAGLRRPELHDADGRGAVGLGDTDRKREDAKRGFPEGTAAKRARSHWAEVDWLPCRDGKSRPVEPGTFPLAHGIPGRVGRLRAYGNAIVPQVAAEVIRAYADCEAGQ
jgi:DNA (cytosine-5)-methyltransferase 1